MNSYYNPRRSVLYMPGSNVRALEKAKTLESDVLILDLEDAVAAEQKVLARKQIMAAIAAGGYGRRELVVRVNGLDTPWGEDDLKAVAESGAHGCCLPKVNSKSDVLIALEVLNKFQAAKKLKLWLMAETAESILSINDIVKADPCVTAVVMGTSDLAKELRVRHTANRIGLVASLNMCVLAARANGIDIIDGVHLDLNDEEGLYVACEQGRDMGFDGKSLIHPKQLSAANEVFGISDADIDHAKRIVAAWQGAIDAGSGVVLLDGKLVENLHVDEAKRLLGMAEVLSEID